MTTIGIRVVCLRTARVTFPPAVMKTATLRPSKSSISLGNRLGSPPALANKILRCAATIVDLKNAADNGGAVNYSFDVVILTPTDPAKANGRLLCEVVSRGRTIALAALQDSNTMDIYNAVRPVMPTEASASCGAKAGNAFLLNQGYTIVLSGWQGDRPEQFRTDKPAAISDKNTWPVIGMTLPVARDVGNGNAPITGTVQDEFIADSPKANLLGTYCKRVPGTSAALIIRKTPTSSPIMVAETLWKYVPGLGTAEGGNAGANGFGYVEIDRAALPATRKTGDPRKSVQELYGSKAAYVDAVNRTVDQLVVEGFILKSGTGGVDDPAEYRNRAQMQVKQSGFQQLP